MKNPINKKTLKKIKQGDMNALLGAIEDLHWLYNEQSFDDGYKSCLQDMAVRSYRLAERIFAFIDVEKKEDGSCVLLVESADNLAKVIEEYFNEALKE